MALVIGNATYDSLSELKTPIRDAEAVSETLSSLGFTVYLAENLAANQFHKAFQFFSEKATGADVALVYYAGHGARIRGKNYLFPTDQHLNQESDLSLAVNLLDVQTLMSRNNSINILMIDSCQDTPQNLTASDDQLLSALAPHSPALGTLIVHASAPGQVAFDGVGKHSLFTGALLDNISRPNIDIETMLRDVRREVLRNSQGTQLPQTLSSLVSDFSFVPAVDQAHHAPLRLSDSLLDSGFSRKPILTQISDGLELSSRPAPDSDLKAQICDTLPFPKPSECDKQAVLPAFSVENTEN